MAARCAPNGRQGFSTRALRPRRPTEGEPVVTLASATSGQSYDEPFDMRDYVCGKKRVRVSSEDDDEGDGDGPPASHLTEKPLNLGPPVKVSAFVPAVHGETSFVARLPRPRPGSNAVKDPEVLNAYAPGTDGNGASAPAEAIGAAAGSAKPLDDITPQ